jgi:hypothetical protein
MATIAVVVVVVESLDDDDDDVDLLLFGLSLSLLNNQSIIKGLV